MVEPIFAIVGLFTIAGNAYLWTEWASALLYDMDVTKTNLDDDNENSKNNAKWVCRDQVLPDMATKQKWKI